MDPARSTLVRVLVLAIIASILGAAVVRTRQHGAAPVARASTSELQSLVSGAADRPAQAPVPESVTGPDVATGTLVARATPAPAVSAATRGGIPCATPHQVVRVPADEPLYAAPGARRIGTLPRSSHYLGQSMVAWVQTVSKDGLWGRVTMPWTTSVTRQGWVPLARLTRSSTRTMVVADLSEHRLRAYRGCTEVLDVAAATGKSVSPSPTGRFWVTDRIAVPRSQPYFGSFAFGLSTFQPHPPPGWTGGNQMAIHGTNDPRAIGTSASAGCLRVDEAAIARLKPLLRPGTPVVIQA